MRKMYSLIAILVVLTMALTACSTPAATEPTAVMEEPTAVMEEPTALPAAVLPTDCLGTAEAAIQDLNCRKVTIAVENAYLPFNYISIETGEPGGWDYDAVNEICARLHCEPVYTEAAWDGMIQAVSDGQFDVAADGITITADRAEVVDFSVGYINIQQRLLVRKGENRFDSIESFVTTDLSMGTQTATTNYETAAKYLPEDRIQAFEQFAFAVQALIAGDIDAVIIDEVVGMGYMGENAADVELIGPAISSDELGFIFPKGSDLVAAFDKAINSMKSDGTLSALNVKYFGPTFDITYDDIAE